ncbi:MAG: ELM1/GtrOC1 family putative glycosyltransferase [Candidatus Thermoplasmatota archaeon]
MAPDTLEGPRLLWDGEGANPYPAFLAHADAFIVPADSGNTCGFGAIKAFPFGQSFTQSWPSPEGASVPSRIRFTDHKTVTVSPGRYRVRPVSRLIVHVRIENCQRSIVPPKVPPDSIQVDPWTSTQ